MLLKILKNITSTFLLVCVTFSLIGVNITKIYCFHCHKSNTDIEIFSSYEEECQGYQKKHHNTTLFKLASDCNKILKHTFYKIEEATDSFDNQINIQFFPIINEIPFTYTPNIYISYTYLPIFNHTIPNPPSQEKLCTYIC